MYLTLMRLVKNVGLIVFTGRKQHTTKTTKFTKTLKLQRTCLELNEKSTKKHQIKGTRSEKKTWLIERT